MTVVYSAGAGVVPKEKNGHRKDSISTIKMHVDSICAFLWIRRYAASRSVFLIRMRFRGYLRPTNAIMWSILRRLNPHRYVCRVSISTGLFMNRPDGPGN